MKKRILALVCLLALMASVFALTATASGTETTTFEVGYNRVDINPYIDPTLTGDAKFAPANIMNLPLRGSGDVWNRPSTMMVDDNYDGVIDGNDGLAATCIALRSGDKTILMITIDLIGSSLISKVRTEVCARVAAECGVEISANEIFYAGTHTHTAPDTTVVGNMANSTGACVFTDNSGAEHSINYADMDAQLQVWIDRTIGQIGDAAVAAVKDLTPATVTKDQLDASAYTTKTMNSTRHYTSNQGYYYGDNFNVRVSGTNASKGVKQVNEVDDTIYLLQFMPEDSTKEPVILTGWRGHPSLNNSNDYEDSSRNGVSSDFVNSYRYALEQKGYRVAFFQGTGGNVNPRGYEYNTATKTIDYYWIDNTAKNEKTSRGNVYGRELAAFAYKCLTDKISATAVAAGEIRTYQYGLSATRQTAQLSDLAYYACQAAQVYYAAGNSGRFLYPSAVTQNYGMSFIKWATAVGYDYTAYSDMIAKAEKYAAASQSYVVASKFHANSIVGKWIPTDGDVAGHPKSTSDVSMELNAILLGEGLAFVTAPGEPFDYYDLNGSTAAADNDWNELINEATYGMPFVLGYCNGAVGYIPNAAAYDYNKGSTEHATGSYETHTTSLAQGTGEAMIQQFKTMLETMSRDDYYYTAVCEHCKSVQTWEPFPAGGTAHSGHFYLSEDTQCAQNIVPAGVSLCLDLRGHTLTGATRAFYLTRANAQSGLPGAKVSIMDSSEGKTGVVRGHGASGGVLSGFGGGAIFVYEGAELNLYGGTVTVAEDDACNTHTVRNAGVIYVRGTFNMYDGCVTGGTAYTWTGYTETTDENGETVLQEKGNVGCGGNIYVDGSGSGIGTFNMYGGSVTGGKLEVLNNALNYENTGAGPCVYAMGYVKLAGDAQIDSIRYQKGSNKAAPDHKSWLTVEGSYTGSVELDYGSVTLRDGDVLGFCGAGTDLSGADISIGSFTAAVRDESLIMVPAGPLAVYTPKTGTYVFCETLAQALEQHQNSATVIVLFEDLASLDLTGAKRNVYLDLNGCDVTGNVTVAEGWSLYCMDSETDDYNAYDRGGYGSLLGTVTGDVRAVLADTVSAPEASGSYRAGYLMLGSEGNISFHRLGLELTKVNLRPGEVAIYYTGSFKGDEVVKANIKSFGIALSTVDVPTAENLKAACEYTVCNAADFGGESKGVMLSGIMKTDNTAAVNRQNAAMPVYGSAYVQLESGYVFSEAVSLSLQQILEAVDPLWEQLTPQQKAAALTMYQAYTQSMEGWNIPNLKAATLQA